MTFLYDEKAIDYLKTKDKTLGKIIDTIGHVERATDDDLFTSVIHHIIGQQISTKALTTIWQRMQDDLEIINVETIVQASITKLQSYGMTFRKAEYIQDFALKVKNGSLDLEALWDKSDDEVISELSSLKGIGKWTAEMILLFCMQRLDVFSYDDLAILRGLRMVYRHRKIDYKLFEKYRRRYSPYGSVASLYLWAVAGGAIPELTDPAIKRSQKPKIKEATK